MTHPLPPRTHEELVQELSAYALDALSPDERLAVESHLKTCALCREELRALSETAAAIGESVAAQPMDRARKSALRQRLVDRAKAESRGVTPIRSAAIPARVSRAPWWLAAAASVAFVAAAYQAGRAGRERDTIRTALSAESLRVAALQDSLAIRERTLLAMAGADVKVVELVANNRRPNARMFWAQSTNTWTMFAHNLPAPAQGRTYQLWLITRAGQRISAGTFAPNPAGSAVVSAQYPLPSDALEMIAVTEEPAGGVPQPTGEVVIAGQPK
jgi:anti-sigma-K factor RskA